jgi:uncharacterized membrane protein
LVRTDVCRIAIKDFSHLENSSRGSKLTPKIFRNFGDGIDSNTVKTICSNQIFYPVFKRCSDVGIALIKVGEVSKAAILNLRLVVKVSDLTSWVVMVWLVKRGNRAIISTYRCDMVCNDINHHPNA